MADPSPNFLRFSWNSLPRPLLLALAFILCAATTVYAFAWIYDQRTSLGYQVAIGINQSRDTFFDPATSSIPIYNVIPQSPAEQAGLRAGDQIVALNRQPLTSYALFRSLWSHSHPGDPIDITVRRGREPELLTVRAIFRSPSPDNPPEGSVRASARRILSIYPIGFVLVGFAVLFLRLDDTYAWLLALLFAGFVAVPRFNYPAILPGLLYPFTSVYRAVFYSLITPLFYIFFALFPEKSPLERRAPWLKWFALTLALFQFFPGLPYGDARLPEFITNAIGDPASGHLHLSLTYGLLVLALISLMWNSVSAETSAESRRKSRVMLAGTFFGVFPFVFEHILIDFDIIRGHFWIDVVASLLVLLYPLSFAYAIVKHRVLAIPALLRRSARYVLVQRGYFLLLFFGGFLAIFLFARVFSAYFAQNSQVGMGLSAAFGIALVWVSSPFVKRGTERIDRAFFRSSYDARMILQDLAQKATSVGDRGELAALLEDQLTQAFHPQSLAIYFEESTGKLVASKSSIQTGPTGIDANALFLRELSARGHAWDVPPPDSFDEAKSFPLAALFPECLVPLLTHGSRLVGLLVLGLPLSEEPYSRQDKRLLDSVANQAAVSLENLRLAEQIADRLEIDRRAEHELQIARDVQSRLFPQVLPHLNSLDYAGSCIQARQVGGDYYDFLDLGSSHMACVLADISGKGIAGALLMANLQANLRSRYAAALDNLPGLLKSVNHMFYENTPDDRYASLFLAVFNDQTRELSYANCGHNPPLLFRADGSLERLMATATVIGLFPSWECDTRTIALHPNDLLVIYTDGVTEANDASGNEFGEARLCETIRRNRDLPPAELLTAIQQAVHKFNPGEPSDDLTLVVARVHSGRPGSAEL